MFGPGIVLSMEEIWKPIRGWEGIYEISNKARVRSLPRVVPRGNGSGPLQVKGQMLNPKINGGYYKVTLYSPRKEKTVHGLMGEHWIPKPDSEEPLMICHGIRGSLDNQLDNLRWGTSSDNNKDIVRDGDHHEARKTHGDCGHVLKEPNLINSRVTTYGHRACKACKRSFDWVFRNPELEPLRSEIADLQYQRILAGSTKPLTKKILLAELQNSVS